MAKTRDDPAILDRIVQYISTGVVPLNGLEVRRKSTLDGIESLRTELAELKAECAANKKDAERYRNLKSRFVGADFEPWFNEDQSEDIGLDFSFPKGTQVGPDLDVMVDAAGPDSMPEADNG